MGYLFTSLLTGFVGGELINQHALAVLAVKFGFNTSVLFVIVRYIYLPTARRKDYLTTFVLIGSTVFLLCYLLENVNLQLGFALGLFAVFGIIRYRTSTIPINEMTYLFLTIGISVMNALTNKNISYSELFFANAVLLIMGFIIERAKLRKHEHKHSIVYDNLVLILPEKRGELLHDLRQRTGMEITRIEIKRVDFRKQEVEIDVFYQE